MNPTLSGAARSKTIYLSLAVMVVAYFQQNPAGLEPLGISAAAVLSIVGVANYFLGLAILVARFFTDGSLADKVAGMGWLRDEGHGDLIQETVNASSLSAFAKSYIEETGKDLPADLFKLSNLRYTSVTKL